MRNLWELKYSWASNLDNHFAYDATPGGKLFGDVRVSSWKLESPTNATLGMGDALRVVFAVRQDAFIDYILGPLVYPCISTGLLPFVVTIIAAMIAAYLRYWVEPDDGDGSKGSI